MILFHCLVMRRIQESHSENQKLKQHFLLGKFSLRNKRNLKNDVFIHSCYFFSSVMIVSRLGRYFWHVQICIHTGKMIALSSFRIYCSDVIKTAKLLNTRNVAYSSKQLFFPYQIVFIKNDNWQVYGVKYNILIPLIPLVPTCLSELFHYTNGIHNHVLRSTYDNHLYMPKPNIELFRNSFSLFWF